MKYPYIVIGVNGKWYSAGEDVPSSAEISSKKVEETKVVEPIAEKEEPTVKPQYNRGQINKMKADEIKKVAIELGFNEEAVEELSASEIKRNVINMLKL